MIVCLEQGANDLVQLIPLPPIVSVSVKSRMVYPCGVSLSGLSWKKAVKRVLLLCGLHGLSVVAELFVYCFFWCILLQTVV